MTLKSDDERELVRAIGLLAYVYGFATVDLYRVFWNEAVDPSRGHHDGVNEFHHIRNIATAADTFIPSPNNDTLYSTAWLDLTAEPLVLTIPTMSGRRFWFPIGDFFHDIVTTLDWRTVGPEGVDVALVGPAWDGQLPDGMSRIEVPTAMAWILERTLTDGTPGDVADVAALQDQFALTPLSAWNDTEPPICEIEYPPPALDADPLRYFAVLDDMLRRNPARSADEGLVASFAHIGIGLSEPFDPDSLDAAAADALRLAVDEGRELLRVRSRELGTTIDGWSSVPLTGTFGTDYLYRATLEFIGLLHGDHTMQAAFTSFSDGDGRRYHGDHSYELTFQTVPPADAFWSLTMYDDEHFLLVDNEIDRYSIGDRTPGLHYDDDGSLTVVIQHDRPADTANWLPAPRHGFYISIRAFNPRHELTSGQWRPPPVQRVR